jgi:hypothetical protein
MWLRPDDSAWPGVRPARAGWRGASWSVDTRSQFTHAVHARVPRRAFVKPAASAPHAQLAMDEASGHAARRVRPTRAREAAAPRLRPHDRPPRTRLRHGHAAGSCPRRPCPVVGHRTLQFAGSSERISQTDGYSWRRTRSRNRAVPKQPTATDRDGTARRVEPPLRSVDRDCELHHVTRRVFARIRTSLQADDFTLSLYFVREFAHAPYAEAPEAGNFGSEKSIR